MDVNTQLATRRRRKLLKRRAATLKHQNTRAHELYMAHGRDCDLIDFVETGTVLMMVREEAEALGVTIKLAKAERDAEYSVDDYDGEEDDDNDGQQQTYGRRRHPFFRISYYMFLSACGLIGFFGLCSMIGW